MPANDLEKYQQKHARLNYLMQLWQFFALQKKEFTIQQGLEDEIKKAAFGEIPAVTEATPITPQIVRP